LGLTKHMIHTRQNWQTPL